MIKIFSYDAFMSLEDHLEERINSPIYQVLKVNLVMYIRDILGLKQFDEQLILKIAAILDTNCFEIRPHQKNTKLRAVYPMAAMISHDCVPNTRHVFDENMQMSVLATGRINKICSLCSYTLMLSFLQWTFQWAPSFTSPTPNP